MIKVRFKSLAIIAYLYITIPIFIFFGTWLKLYIGIPMAAVFGFGLWKMLKKDYFGHMGVLEVPRKALIVSCILLLTWVWVSGNGGFFYQTWDQHWRNAVLRDLINYSWPVVYPETGGGLVYYLMHWIVPAIFGKLFGWTAANIVLFIWTTLGVLLTFFLLLYICKACKSWHVITISIVFITFSGLNQIGMALMDLIGKGTYGLTVLGSEGQAFSTDAWLNGINGIQYSSNNTLLAWVYNQTIVPWIALPLILENRKVRNFAFIGLCILPYAPLPFCGFLALFIILACMWMFPVIKKRQFKLLAGEVFSVPNLCSIFSVFIVFLLYFKNNVQGTTVGTYIQEDISVKQFLLLIIAFALFWLLKVGIYYLLLLKNYKKDFLFVSIGIVLMIIPFIKIGSSADFCMRASIPWTFLLMIYVLQYFIKEGKKSDKMLTRVCLIIVLTLGGYNIFTDTVWEVKQIYMHRQFPIVADEKGSFENDKGGGNFVTDNADEKAFYKYLGR
ncbi:hypothetical protein [Murimonas intestini]|uniref:Uncharacterized protein n=1 Tax=Murimonas intestini TaxID=1337051 RepID=A0AB73SZ34_9FIRM|nr:hypothetical protein [Murimonas intestini]MCR1842976.1 hypothetical protein [Murimonas intestini]MCR1867977.1 hypothetical protein [Murimonas intestini]MCR1885445.1 hypothetical protein [Murimonas intestini]